MSKQILFFGNERLATGVKTKAPIFQALINNGYRVQALVISAQQNSDLSGEPVAEIAKKHNIEILNLPTLTGAGDILRAYEADTAVLAAYGKIVPESILNVFKNGIINVHPSLLPKHRGPTPIESVILNGEKQSGVSIMKLVKAMDAGPVYVQKALALKGTESKQELADILGQAGKELLIENLDEIISGKLPPKEQDNSKATYDKLITKEDGRINWDLPAERIVNQIKAYQFWPRSYSTIGDIEIVITAAHRENNAGIPGQHYIDGKKLGVFSSRGSVVIDKLIPSGKNEMSAESFIAGYRNRLG